MSDVERMRWAVGKATAYFGANEEHGTQHG